MAGTHSSVLSVDDWQVLSALAATVANTEFVPKDLRGSNPKVLACFLSGKELDLPPMTSLREISIIEGKPSMSAALITAKVRDAGHRMWREEHRDADGKIIAVTAHGERSDGEKDSFRFGAPEAVKAGLAGKQNFQKYPTAMYWARAATQLARFLFSAVFMGSVYTPEELGGTASADDIVEEPDAPAAIEERIAAVVESEPPPVEAPPAVEEAEAEPLLDKYEESYAIVKIDYSDGLPNVVRVIFEDGTTILTSDVAGAQAALDAQEPEDDDPFAELDKATVPNAIKMASGQPLEWLTDALAHEQAGKARKGVVDAITGMVAELTPAESGGAEAAVTAESAPELVAPVEQGASAPPDEWPALGPVPDSTTEKARTVIQAICDSPAASWPGGAKPDAWSASAVFSAASGIATTVKDGAKLFGHPVESLEDLSEAECREIWRAVDSSVRAQFPKEWAL